MEQPRTRPVIQGVVLGIKGTSCASSAVKKQVAPSTWQSLLRAMLVFAGDNGLWKCPSGKQTPPQSSSGN